MLKIAVIFAGGVGSRMHSKSKPKQFLEMHGKPIIIHTLEVFDRHPEIDAIVVACKEEWIDYCQKLLVQFGIQKVCKIVPGGKTGQLSIYHGLLAAEKLAGGEPAIVLIHDGVRPLIDAQLITGNIQSVKEHGSAITTVPVQETVIITDDNSEIQAIPDRSHSRLARAPQSFWLSDILEAHRQSLAEGIDNFIDSCSMMKHFGKHLYLIDGPRDNIKVTTPEDFYVMRAILDAKENAQIYGFSE